MNFKSFRNQIVETSDLNKETIPAAMLVLKRRGVRFFPDGRKVALYTNDKYNLVITVPYGGTSGVVGPDSKYSSMIGVQQ